MGDNGILTRAKDAKNVQANAEKYENKLMENFETEINKVWPNS